VTNLKKISENSGVLNVSFLFTPHTTHTITYRLIFLKDVRSTIISNRFTFHHNRYLLKGEMYFLHLSGLLIATYRLKVSSSSTVRTAQRTLSQL